MKGNTVRIYRSRRRYVNAHVPKSLIREASRLENRACSSGKKFSLPTISVKLLALMTSRLMRGKPSGSTFLADRNDDTGVMLRIVEDPLADEESLSLDGVLGIEGDPKPGFEMAVTGRDIYWTELALSFSSTFSASDMIRFAMRSKTSITFTMALLARRLSRPAMAIKAYVLFIPRDRGSCKRKMYAIL